MLIAQHASENVAAEPAELGSLALEVQVVVTRHPPRRTVRHRLGKGGSIVQKQASGIWVRNEVVNLGHRIEIRVGQKTARIDLEVIAGLLGGALGVVLNIIGDFDAGALVQERLLECEVQRIEVLILSVEVPGEGVVAVVEDPSIRVGHHGGAMEGR